jgi:sugar transferase (PEP-CTERM/EpsH1 system associated)
VRVLLLTHRLPYAPNRGDRIRAYHLVRSIAAYADVDLVSLVHDAEEMSHVGDLGSLARVRPIRVRRVRNMALGALSLAGRRPLTHALLDSPDIASALRDTLEQRHPDVVLAYCSGMARFAMEAPLAGLPYVLDLVDVDSEKWASLARTSVWPRRLIYSREATTLGTFERAAASDAFATFVVNERERDALLTLAPRCRVHVVPNGIDVAAFAPLDSPAPSANVVFCGVMDYEPNVAAASWLAREVWPLVLAQRADARLQLVGSSPARAVQSLAAVDSSVEVTGTVPAVQPFLWNAAVSVAPLHVARGIQNKVLEALAAGVPAVVSSAVVDGLPLEARAGCMVANTAHEVARAVVELLSLDPGERRACAALADLTRLSWESRLAGVRAVLEEAAANRHGTAPLNAN